jgi:chromosome segregation ATPase
LKLLIDQRNYWKDRSERFEQAVTQLSEKLASTERLLMDSPDPRALLEEILSLRQQLRDAMASLDESKASLASADQQIAEAEDRIRLAEEKAKRLERSRNGWRAGAIAAIAAAVAAGIWAAMK